MGKDSYRAGDRSSLRIRVDGSSLTLRLVQAQDAEYIHGLRIDSTYNKFLSPVLGTVHDQRRWIESYKARERDGSEYYFVIQRLLDRIPCGVVRLYNIWAGEFTWGSWILDRNKPPKAALESAVLSLGIAFDDLKLRRALLDVRVGNHRAIDFYRRFGMTQIGEDETNLYFQYTCEQFSVDRCKYRDIILRASSK